MERIRKTISIEYLCVQKIIDDKTFCEELATHNIKGRPHGMYCKMHAHPGMINVSEPTCEVYFCMAKPTHNKKDSLHGMYCKKHAPPDMVNVVNKKLD